MPVIEPVRAEIAVDLPLDKAFALFTDQFSHWWPREYSWAGDVLEDITIEPRAGGRCTEYGPNAFQADWGTVQCWEPPRQLVLLWQIGPRSTPEPDPAKASTLHVMFQAERGSRTRVEVTHTAFENHGEGAEQYRQEMASEYGWPFLLARYLAAAT